MLTSLVVTKLYIPPTRPNLVARPRLLAQLDEGLRAGKRLALLSAPAGFGKTTLITEWVCATAREIAWLSLDEGDNDPLHFLAYLIAALQQADGRIGRSVQALLQPAGLAQTNATALDRLIAPLIADIAAAGTPLVLVLDDYHFITNDAVHAITRFLLENQPPIMHTVINTREDPPLPLPRLRARNQVVELRERDLRFTAAEAAAFLSQTMRLTLSPQVVEALEARTEGWIAGLQLAALALQDMATRQGGQADTRTFIAAFSGDNRYVLDYLVAEVLQRQPPAVRDFLRQTVILDRLTAPLCDAVTDRDDSQAMLERLEAANLFLIPLDHRREWYRYHRLFAETLRPTLPPDKAARLHHRAALWYERQGELSTAIQHALSGAAVADDPAVANGLLNDAERLIRQAAEPTLHSGGVTTVRGWLDALPDACVRADSTLATTKGWILVFTGDVEPAEVYADAAEACLRATYPDAFPDAADKRPRPGKIPPADLGKLWLLRGYIALGRRDYECATEHIDAALRLLKKEHPHWRILGLWGMAEAEERTGDIAKAIATLREAQQIGKSLENQVFAVVVEMSLAAALDSHGKRREAVALCHQAIERYTEAAGQPSPLAGLVFTRLALLHYEANQLELARRYLEQGQALSEPLAIGSLLMLSLGIAAPILYACGETEAALDAVQRAQHFASQEALTDAHWLAATEANLRLRQGDLNFVIQWAETMQLSLDDNTPAYLRIEGHLVYARLLLAQGRIADARQWLARLERFTQERGLGRWLVTVYILQALTEAAAGYHPTALERLTRAVKLAAPQDYVRAFLDEDARVLALLPDVKRAAPAFVEQVVAEGGAVRDRPQHREDRPQHREQALVEPLSEREIEVLRMLAVGASNKEIAAKLFIATGTVKQHLKSIYSKLDVHNRTEATHRAGELGLL